MTSKIKIKRGTRAQLPALELAEPGFTTDTKELYIGDGIGNVKIGGSVDFLGLNDTPSDYIGNENSYLQTTSSGIVFVAKSTATGFVYTDIPTTVTGTPGMGSITFSVESPIFNISPVFGNNVIWLAENSTGGIEDCFWARASNDNTYLNWGSGDHFYLRDNDAIIHYDFSSDGLDMDDNNLNTTGNITATEYYGDGSNLTGVASAFIDLTDVPSTFTGASERVVSVKSDETGLEFTIPSTGGVTPALSCIDVYDNTGGQTFTNTTVTLNLDTVRKNVGGFSLASDEVTVVSGTYSVFAKVSVGSNGRATAEAWIELDTGSGYFEVDGTRGIMYCRDQSSGENTCTIPAVLDLSDDDKLRIRMIRTTGSTTITTRADAGGLVITTLGGPAGLNGVDGNDGNDGTDGAPGPSGSGSSINIYDAGTMISGTPFSAINFTGLDIEESVTSGTVNITYVPPVFGTWYGWSSSESESSTTSTSWQQKLTYPLTNVLAGNYRIGFQFEWRRNAANNDFTARVQVDNTTTVANLNIENKDSNSWNLAHGFYVATLTAGNHFIDIDYAGENTDNTSFIRAARIECYRVS